MAAVDLDLRVLGMKEPGPPIALSWNSDDREEEARARLDRGTRVVAAVERRRVITLPPQSLLVGALALSKHSAVSHIALQCLVS